METKTIVISKTAYGNYSWSTEVYDVALYIDGTFMTTITYSSLETVEEYYPKSEFKWIKINF